MARYMVAIGLAAIATVFLRGAIRFRRYGNRDGFWVALTASTVVAIGAWVVTWLVLPEPHSVPMALNGGFGPGWQCANTPYYTFCFRQVPHK